MKDEQNSKEPGLLSIKEMNGGMGEIFDINDLTRAVKEDKIDAVKELLDLGIDIDEVDEHNFTPLQMAAKCGHYEIAGLLLDKGAGIKKRAASSHKVYGLAQSSSNPDDFNYDNLDPLQLAVKCNQIKVVELLFNSFKEGEFDDYEGDSGRVLLIKALGNVEMVNTLLDTVARLKLHLWTDCTLLEYIDNGFIEGVRCLLKHGVSPATDGESYYMHKAVGNIPIMELLLSHGGDDLLNERNDDDLDLLEHAIRENEFQTAKWLVNDKGFEIKGDSQYVHYAVQGYNINQDPIKKLQTFKLLNEWGCSFDQVNNMGFKPIHYAAMYREPSILEYFLDRDFDVNYAAAPRGDSLLHLAVQENNSEMVDYLISKGANINIKNGIGEIPIQAYKGSYPAGSYEIKKKLIIAGSSVPDLNNLFQKDWNGIIASCSLPEKLIVFINLYYVIYNLDNFNAKTLKQIHEQIEQTRDKIIENLNKKAWDRREQIKLCEETLDLLPKAKLFRWMEADIEKFVNRLQDRKEVLKTNDRDILEIFSKSLNQKLINGGEVKHIENMREFLSKEDKEIKKAYEACMFNKSAFKDVAKKGGELIKLGLIRESIEKIKEINKRLKSTDISNAIEALKIQNTAEKIAIYQEESKFNPNAVNELFEISTIKDGQEEIV
ncbi:hypothetical protein phytr_2400 [Candidatus Phycorickettsia trachydisci]|uniref:Uncharacterized protein n=1 Tax=Candidatus Phycorickettsia trachydisci TaxID=2115978 RepID=A0A2P1P7F3_9RICK|nr:ankyrin repeat domain-containing protein [Candidatus Phycorickettsia trachydisci]AVP87197.1 hypothetical protein phytr_2400 [Candidatus Phycorickettsia trachydisci]